MKVLLELRPALAGHAGIPQETRLLFSGLARLDGVQVDGLLQSSNQLLARGLPADEGALRLWRGDRRAALARVAASLHPGDTIRARRLLRLLPASAATVAASLLGRRHPLTRFEPAGFEDFLWRALFAKTLPPEDFATVTAAQYRVARLPWSAAHGIGVLSGALGAALYPTLDTRGYDVLLAETPFPGRVKAPTRLVVRYHDAIPLLMPHTVRMRAYDQAAHRHALRRNVEDGAWFACVSDATRRDLLSVFPQAHARAVTIPNMVSNSYFAQESARDTIPDILRRRGNPVIAALAGTQGHRDPDSDESGEPSVPRYLLMVSTLEPRKNHDTLIAAWERLRAAGQPSLQLVLVGALGWNNTAIVHKLLPGVARGEVHVLADVPAAELRQLYKHAAATVCPSLGEGFGYSGVESMCCGGVVVASDLPVHREVYGDGAEYFDPQSVEELVDILGTLLGRGAHRRREALIHQGAAICARYRIDNVLPKWRSLLDQALRAQ